MKYCKQCGAQMKDGAAFCPVCGTKTDEADSINVWESIYEHEHVHHTNPVTDNEVVRNLMQKIPDGTKGQMKELSEKVTEGMNQLADKAREYGGKFTEKAGNFAQNTSKATRDISSQTKNNEVVNVKNSGNRKIRLAILIVLFLAIGIGSIYYLSRFTLVGVWKVVDTEDVDLSDIDLTNPEDILEKALLTLGSGTRMVFTKGGDVFATASLGGVTIGPGTMGYSKNGNDSFTIHASINAVVTTLNADYRCGYEFDGPDRLLIYIGDAVLTLTRDKDGDPEEYLNQIQESTLGIHFDLGGDEEEKKEMNLPETGEEMKEEIQGIKDGVSNFFGMDSYGGN